MPITSCILRRYAAKYGNGIFIETGSFMGDGIQAALDAGFQNILSVELAPYHCDHCLRRFKNEKAVNLRLGDSGVILVEVARNLQQRAVFWLDGHYSGGGTAKGIDISPLMRELDAIKHSPRKDHVILIDDTQFYTRAEGGTGFDIGDIVRKLYEINECYDIRVDVDNPCILTATPDSQLV
jgi:hypothetical protein